MSLIHTCYRITDVDRSVAFYEALGFKEVGRLPIKDEAINVFMNQPGDGDMPRLELTYNFGVDAYEIGTGYGHIAITTTDLDSMLEQLAGLSMLRTLAAAVAGAAGAVVVATLLSPLAPVLLVGSFFIPTQHRAEQASTPDTLYLNAIGGLLQTQLGFTDQSNQLRPRARNSLPVPALTRAAVLTGQTSHRLEESGNLHSLLPKKFDCNST